MKNVIIGAVVLVVIAVAGYFAYTKMNSNKVALEKTDFGYTTLALINKDTYKISCDDAKSLVKMINSINQDFAENPELGASVSTDNMTPSMKNFEDTMDKFGKVIEDRYTKDETKKNKIYEGIGEGVSSIFQVAIMTHLGMLQPVDMDEYIGVTYCDVAAKPGYVSPLEMAVGTDEEMMAPPAGMPSGMPSDNTSGAQPAK